MRYLTKTMPHMGLNEFCDEICEAVFIDPELADHLCGKTGGKRVDDRPRSEEGIDEVNRKLVQRYGFPMVATQFFGGLVKAHQTEIVDRVPVGAIKVETIPEPLRIGGLT